MIEKEIKHLIKLLKELLSLPPKEINDLRCKNYENKNGVYAIYEKSNLRKPIYIGKTTRQKRGVRGRMDNLLGDCLSHSLNFKILCDKILNWDKEEGRKRLLNKWNDLSDEKRTYYRKEARNYIENTLRVKFKELNEEITRFEHFAIGVINPKLND